MFALFDPDRELFEWFLVTCSCLIAVVASFLAYSVVDNTSTLTYNMLGDIKFIVTIIVGYMIFDEDMTEQQMAAVFVVLIGLTVYTGFKTKKVAIEINPPFCQDFENYDYKNIKIY
jgi:multidrug transporter EmrE-like cation transporter